MDLLRAHIATAANCLPPPLEWSAQIERVRQIVERLAAEGIRFARAVVALGERGDAVYLRTHEEIGRCAREDEGGLTPEWHQRFRLIWLAMHNARTVRRVMAVARRVDPEDAYALYRAGHGKAVIDARVQRYTEKVLAALKRVFLADGRLPPLARAKRGQAKA